MKKFRGILLCMTVLLLVPQIVAAQAHVTHAQVQEYIASALASLSGQTPRNDPQETYDPSGEGAYLYDYGQIVLQLTTQEVGTDRVQQLTITERGVAGPGGIQVGDTEEAVLAAFANDNPALSGNESFATLYAAQKEGEGGTNYEWAWVLRSQNTVYGIEYMAGQPDGAGKYIDSGVLFVMDAGCVSSIRVYGAAQQITAEEARMNYETALEMQGQSSYAPMQAIALANTQEALREAELTIKGASPLGMDERRAMEAYGEALSVAQEEDESAQTHRVWQYDGFSLLFDASDIVVEEVVIQGGQVVGPRGFYVGMPLSEALSQLRLDGAVYEQESATLYTAGEAVELPPYAVYDVFDPAHAALRIGVPMEEAAGSAVLMYCDIVQGKISEIRLSTYLL